MKIPVTHDKIFSYFKYLANKQVLNIVTFSNNYCKGGIKVIKVSEPLSVARFTGDEFEQKSVLNSGVTVQKLNEEIRKITKKNQAKRMKARKKY